MNTEDALFDVIETFAQTNDDLLDVAVISSIRGRIDKQDKTIRVQLLNGLLSPNSDFQLKEQNCEFVIQCVSKVKGTTTEAEQIAQQEADTIGKAVFDLLYDNNLNNTVCSLSFFEDEKNFDRGIINIGATLYGSFYIYGLINPI